MREMDDRPSLILGSGCRNTKKYKECRHDALGVGSFSPHLSRAFPTKTRDMTKLLNPRAAAIIEVHCTMHVYVVF